MWLVNGTQRSTFLPDIRIDLVVSEITNPEGHSVQTLTIPARAQYNGTRVQCLSVIIGVSRAESDNATLTIQGISSLPPTVCYHSTCILSTTSVTVMVCVKLLSIFCTTVYEEVKGIALR